MWSWVPSMGEKNINSRFHLFDIISWSTSGSPPSLVGKEPACNAGDLGSLPGTGRSPGEGNSNPLQYSCLEKPMDKGAWRTIVPGVTSQTRLRDYTTTTWATSTFFTNFFLAFVQQLLRLQFTSRKSQELLFTRQCFSSLALNGPASKSNNNSSWKSSQPWNTHWQFWSWLKLMELESIQALFSRNFYWCHFSF